MGANPTAEHMLPDALRASLEGAQAQVNTLLLGKTHEVRLAFVALLAGGHILIEDLPGLGKTTLARAMSTTLGLDFQRVQFTSDLLPLAVFFWATALVTKLQVLPFWAASLLVPLAVCLYKKTWSVAGLLVFALISSVITSRLLLLVLELSLKNPTLPTLQLKGLYQVTALVTALPARLFS